MNESIKQLLPVSGWHAVVASREGTTDEIIIEAVPLIAWAVIDGERKGREACETADSVQGVCILENLPLVCDGFHFREFSGRMFVGYCREGQLEERMDYFRNLVAFKLRMGAVKWKIDNKPDSESLEGPFPEPVPDREM